MGYTWAPQFRMVPENGREETMILSAVFSDAGGPTEHRVLYQEDIDEREDINRRMNSYIPGIRVIVEQEFVITTMADHTYLATIVSRLLRPDWAVYLSLDGGTTDREVELVRVPSPRPLGDKTILGARFLLRVQTIDLIPELPSLETGEW